MKKILLRDELNLTKEIIAHLSPEQLQEIEGGAAAQGEFSCFDASCITKPPSEEEISN